MMVVPASNDVVRVAAVVDVAQRVAAVVRHERKRRNGASLLQATRLALCVFVHEKILIRWIYLEGGLLEYLLKLSSGAKNFYRCISVGRVYTFR